MAVCIALYVLVIPPLETGGPILAAFVSDSATTPNAERLSEIVAGQPVKWSAPAQGSITLPKYAMNVHALSADGSPVAVLAESESGDTVVYKINSSSKVYVLYETPAPEIEEENVSVSKKSVFVSSELSYTNVEASAQLPREVNDTSSIRLTWKVYAGQDISELNLTDEQVALLNSQGFVSLPLNFTAKDTDGNGLYDTIVWIVPHLSEQEFEIEILGNGVGISWVGPTISFIPPTPANGSTISVNSAVIRANITNVSSLNQVNFTWDGNTTSVYDYSRDASLLVRYNFNNVSAIGDGGSKVVDVSRYGNNGTITGTLSYTEGKYGNALSQSSQGQSKNKVRISSSVRVPANMTILAWVKPAGFPAGSDSDRQRAIVERDGGSEGGLYCNHNDFTLRLDNKGLSTAYNANNGCSWEWLYYTNSSMVENEWMLVGAIFENSSRRLAIIHNGNIVAEKIGSLQPTVNNNPDVEFRLFESGSSSWAMAFVGAIDEFALYNRTLSAAEIRAYYEHNVGKYSDSNYILDASKSGFAVGQHNYSVSVSDSMGTSVSSQVFTYAPQLPTISFVSPTPANGSVYQYDQNYLPINVTVDDFNYGNLTNITLYVYNASGLMAVYSSTTRPLFVNITNLLEGNYTYNATAFYSNTAPVTTETRSFAYVPCTLISNGQTVSISANQKLLLCPGNYSNVYFVFQGANASLNCNGSQFSGPGYNSDLYGLNLSHLSDNVSISGCDFRNYGRGLYIKGTSGDRCSGVSVYNSTFSENAFGVYAEYADRLLLHNVTSRSSRSYWAGVWPSNYETGGICFDGPYSTNSMIVGGIYTNCSRGGILFRESGSSNISIINATVTSSAPGILLSSVSGALVEGSTSNSNTRGISLVSSGSVVIRSNAIQGNSEYGVYSSGSAGSYIYDNYFSNSNNAYFADNYNSNYLNTTVNCSRANKIGGSCTGGNFWSDYLGNDDGSGSG
ncbi:MAG: right-handed parallel beta-helix repeat-containing protein, partial [Candidatus Micrarchaeota archaeon]|nr:right-handed parallel beta-helix repeat-containing protein [Candidatus Micrarchaeota archaeon]